MKFETGKRLQQGVLVCHTAVAWPASNDIWRCYAAWGVQPNFSESRGASLCQGWAIPRKPRPLYRTAPKSVSWGSGRFLDLGGCPLTLRILRAPKIPFGNQTAQVRLETNQWRNVFTECIANRNKLFLWSPIWGFPNWGHQEDGESQHIKEFFIKRLSKCMQHNKCSMQLGDIRGSV